MTTERARKMGGGRRQPLESPRFLRHCQFEGVEFGWQAIMDLYHRECERRNNGLARMIPHLREVHVLRDVWMKLNVHPTKIMQQEQVLMNSTVTSLKSGNYISPSFFYIQILT